MTQKTESEAAELKRLSKRLNYQFINEALLIEALSHRSTGARNYERLEFLGDSALSFVISTELYKLHPDLDEGSLSRLRASLVKGVTLAKISRELELGQYLRLGSGELKSGGFERDSILSDVIESIIGAAFLDQGYDRCRELILHLFRDRINALPPAGDLKDPKTRLQEALQGAGLTLPTYTLEETIGKAHAQNFKVSCSVDEYNLTVSATGSSRRKAEQSAAADMLEMVSRRIR